MENGQFTIKPAVRTRQPALIAFWGGSSSGKTYSALRLARGLVGQQGKIGVIDTENRRALLYAGKVGGTWDHMDFQPPFTPERFVEAFRAFENAGGYNCIIIDSASHVWEGEGGVMDQADSNRSPGLAKWAKPKMALKRMVNTLLRSPCHVIFCMRAKMGVAQEGRGRDAKIFSTGLEPIMEKNLIYEMLVSVLFGPDHKPLFQAAGERYWVNPIIPAVKLPEDLQHVVKPGEYITEATGEAIRVWIDGASRELLAEAKRVAERGSDAFRGWWPSLSNTDKASLKSHVPELKMVAANADKTMTVESAPSVDHENEQIPADTEQNDALASGFNNPPEQETPPPAQPKPQPAKQQTSPPSTPETNPPQQTHVSNQNNTDNPF